MHLCVHYEHIAFVFSPHSLSITWVVSLTDISDSSDPLSYNCSSDFPMKGTMTENPPSISNYCQFNKAGKFELEASFDNDASSYKQSFNFTINDGNGCITFFSCFGIVGTILKIAGCLVHYITCINCSIWVMLLD